MQQYSVEKLNRQFHWLKFDTKEISDKANVLRVLDLQSKKSRVQSLIPATRWFVFHSPKILEALKGRISRFSACLYTDWPVHAFWHGPRFFIVYEPIVSKLPHFECK